MKGKTGADCTVKKDVLEVALYGEIDHHTARPVREKIDAALCAKRPRVLRLFLDEVAFMDSAGLGLILGRVAGAQQVGAEVELYGADTRMLKIFEMAGLFRMKGLCIVDRNNKGRR